VFSSPVAAPLIPPPPRRDNPGVPSRRDDMGMDRVDAIDGQDNQ
jgi:hypothetical protein